MGKEIILINVPQASYQQKPVYINDNPFKGTFKRNHEGDYHCSIEEVKAMIRDASDAGNDGSILDGYTMEDIDSETLRAYRIEYKMRNPDYIWNNLDDKEFLRILRDLKNSRLCVKIDTIRDLQEEEKKHEYDRRNSERNDGSNEK